MLFTVAQIKTKQIGRVICCLHIFGGLQIVQLLNENNQPSWSSVHRLVVA
jgi:hypothetical protein